MGKRLNQLLAIEKGMRQQIQKEITELHRVSQKDELYEGLARDYTPLDEDGEKLPPESKIVQQRANDILAELAKCQGSLINVVASKDTTNMHATASIEVGDLTIDDIPATHLLWLEKVLEDIHTFVNKMPTLDPSVIWKHDEAQNCMATDVVHTNRTKKIPRNHVVAEATKEYPAQVEVYTEDKAVGVWNAIRYSGRLSVERKRMITDRIRVLQQSVKQNTLLIGCIAPGQA